MSALGHDSEINARLPQSNRPRPNPNPLPGKAFIPCLKSHSVVHASIEIYGRSSSGGAGIIDSLGHPPPPHHMSRSSPYRDYNSNPINLGPHSNPPPNPNLPPTIHKPPMQNRLILSHLPHQLNIILHNHHSQQQFDLIRRKESSRTGVTAESEGEEFFVWGYH